MGYVSPQECENPVDNHSSSFQSTEFPILFPVPGFSHSSFDSDTNDMNATNTYSNPYDLPKCRLSSASYSMTRTFPCTYNSLAGIIYDLAHWKEIPRSGVLQKLWFAFTWGDRLFFMLFFIVLILTVILIIKLSVAAFSGKNYSHSYSYPYPYPYPYSYSPYPHPLTYFPQNTHPAVY